MSDSTQLSAPRPLVKASTELSTYLGMEVSAMIDALKSQAFKGKRPDEVTDAQLATYISTANALKLNPLLPGQMYAYPDRQGGGVTVMIGPDGVFTLLSNNPDVVAQKDGGPAFWTEHGVDAAGKDTCTGYINHRTKGLLKKTIWVDEWVVSSNPNWQSRRHHMGEIRALKQTARMVIHGLPVDSDEHALGEMLNVTDTAPESTEAAPIIRPPPPPKAKKGVNAITEPPKPDAKNEAIEAEIVKPKAEEAPPSTPEPAKAPAPVARAFLKDKEEFTGVCKIEKVSAFSMLVAGVATPTVSAVVSGDFTGTVMHIGGGVALPEPGKFAPSPEWEVGSTVALHLLGKGALTTKKNDKGEIAKDDKGVAIKVPTTLHTVTKIVPQEAASESPAVEVDE